MSALKDKKVIPFLLLILFLFSCSPSKNNNTESAVVYARGFTVTQKTGSKTIVTDYLKNRFTIIHNALDQNEPSSYYTIYAPVKSVISTSAPAVSLIGSLGETDSLVGVKLPQKAWHIKEVREKMKAGIIAIVGDGSHEYIDYEQVLTLKLDIIFNNIDYPAKWTAILKKRGVKTASVCTHKEDSLLGQFEWVKMVGAFYNRGYLANTIFNEKADRYNALKESISKDIAMPKVLWGTVIKHRASVPGGASFIANAIKDSGGDYLLQKELEHSRGGYISCDLELFYTKGIDADVFVLSSTKAGGIKCIEDLIKLNGMFKNFKSVKERNVWCYKPWFWQSVDKPDEIFSDIVAIIHPDMFPDAEIRYFERL